MLKCNQIKAFLHHKINQTHPKKLIYLSEKNNQNKHQPLGIPKTLDVIVFFCLKYKFYNMFFFFYKTINLVGGQTTKSFVIF